MRAGFQVSARPGLLFWHCLQGFVLFFPNKHWLGKNYYFYVWNPECCTFKPQFSGEFLRLCLFQLDNESQNSDPRPRPLVTVDHIVPATVVGPGSFHQLSRSSLVFRVSLCEGNRSSQSLGVPGWLSLSYCSGEPPSYDTGQGGSQPARWDSHHVSHSQ